MLSEQDQFLSDLEVENSKEPFASLNTEATEPEKEIVVEDDEMKAKNRRERRLLEKNQQMREEAIAAQARLQGITESQKIREDNEPAEYLKRIEKIYGTTTPEAIEATNLLKEALAGVEESATRKAVEKFEAQRQAEAQATKAEEKTLDEMAERWEDEYGIDMSDSATRKAIYALTEKLSRKDSEGNIKEYPDPDGVADVFLATREKQSNRAKELSSRSMTRSGASQPSKLQEDANWQALKDAGIF